MAQRLTTVTLLILMGWQWSAAQQGPYFDGREAFRLLEAQTALGPRFPGSPGHTSMVNFLEEQLRPLAHELVVQVTRQPHPYRGDTLEIINFLARFNPASPVRLLMLAHYDTRAVADQDPDPANRSRPILGANDGASGVAVLLHLAALMAREPPPVGVDLLLVDAEDVGRSGDLDNFALGTKAFVREMEQLLGGIRPRYAVLLDMVGDAQLRLPMEYYSWRDARELTQRIWELAQDLGYSQFVFEIGPAVYDDHLPLLEAGIPAVDIIDMDYPAPDGPSYWHTLEDTPDKCSPESLEAVGTVITTLIYSERP